MKENGKWITKDEIRGNCEQQINMNHESWYVNHVINEVRSMRGALDENECNVIV